MTGPELPPSAVNVFRGLTGDGLTMVEDAERSADPEQLAALVPIKERIAAGETFGCDCSECGTWDGVYRRCSCGNRRVCWLWEGGRWRPEVY